jgi:GT2 family glycosyltransferase
LLRVAQYFEGRDAPDVVYADHDVYRADGSRGDPFHKPGWSPELLVGIDYIGSFVCLTRSAVESVLAADAAPVAGTYDLLLRLVDTDVKVVRIADVLWSTSLERRAVPADSEVRALARRRGVAVSIRTEQGQRVVRWPLAATPKVSIIIPTAHRGDLLVRCLASIRARSTYPNIEVVVVESRAREPSAVIEDPGCEVHRVAFDGPFNYSVINNTGVAHATGEYLLFLNDDTEIDTPDWIEALLEQAQQPGVGVVGATLVYPDGVQQASGVVLVDGPDGARVIGLGCPRGDPGYHGMTAVARNVSAVCGACMMISRELFVALGMFDRRLAVDLNDVDLCLRALDAGFRVVQTPHAVIRHHDRASRGSVEQPRDHRRFRRRWRSLIAEDPYYNPALSQLPGREYELDLD